MYHQRLVLSVVAAQIYGLFSFHGILSEKLCCGAACVFAHSNIPEGTVCVCVLRVGRFFFFLVKLHILTTAHSDSTVSEEFLSILLCALRESFPLSFQGKIRVGKGLAYRCPLMTSCTPVGVFLQRARQTHTEVLGLEQWHATPQDVYVISRVCQKLFGVAVETKCNIEPPPPSVSPHGFSDSRKKTLCSWEPGLISNFSCSCQACSDDTWKRQNLQQQWETGSGEFPSTYARVGQTILKWAAWLWVFVPTKQQHTRLHSFNQLIWVFKQLIGVFAWSDGTKTWSHAAYCGIVCPPQIYAVDLKQRELQINQFSVLGSWIWYERSSSRWGGDEPFTHRWQLTLGLLLPVFSKVQDLFPETASTLSTQWQKGNPKSWSGESARAVPSRRPPLSLPFLHVFSFLPAGFPFSFVWRSTKASNFVGCTSFSWFA